MSSIKQWLTNTFELTHSHDNNKNIASMEGIRGIAAFLVFLEHYVAVVEERIGISDNSELVFSLYLWIRNIGSVGVDLFFVLSGYLIYGTIISKKRAFLPYMGRRVKRIYPTYIAVFFLYIVLSFLVPESRKIPIEIGAAISYLIQSFLFIPPLFSDTGPLITVAWSLSYEMLYYILIPIIVGALTLRGWKVSYRVILFITLAIVGHIYFYYYDGPIRMLMFVAGILLFEVINNYQKQVTTPYLGGLVFIASLVAIVLLMLFEIPHGGWWRQVIVFIGFFMLCYECFSWNSPTSRLFSFNLLRWFGNMSYSYYLIHGLVVQFIILIAAKYQLILPIESVSTFMIFGIIIFSATLIPATLLFLYIEKPFSLSKK